jgi:hypothetical protein
MAFIEDSSITDYVPIYVRTKLYLRTYRQTCGSEILKVAKMKAPPSLLQREIYTFDLTLVRQRSRLIVTPVNKINGMTSTIM